MWSPANIIIHLLRHSPNVQGFYALLGSSGDLPSLSKVQEIRNALNIWFVRLEGWSGERNGERRNVTKDRKYIRSGIKFLQIRMTTIVLATNE